VRHLVQDRVGAVLVFDVGDGRAEDVILLAVHDTAEVLHRAGVEFGHVELVVFGQRITHAELLVEEVEALLGDQEDVVVVDVLLHRLAAEDTHVDAVVNLADLVVRAGADRGDVGGHAYRLTEVDGLGALNLGVLDSLDLGVGDDQPV